jgi:hypothetical protein
VRLAALAAGLFYGRDALALAIKVERVLLHGRALGLTPEEAADGVADAFERARTSGVSTDGALDALERRWVMDLTQPTHRRQDVNDKDATIRTERVSQHRHRLAWSALWSSLPPHLAVVPVAELTDHVRDAITGMLELQGYDVASCAVTVAPATDRDGTVEEERLVLLVDVYAAGWEPVPFEATRLVSHAVDHVASSALTWTVAPGPG